MRENGNIFKCLSLVTHSAESFLCSIPVPLSNSSLRWVSKPLAGKMGKVKFTGVN